MRRFVILTTLALGLMVPAYAAAHPHGDGDFDLEKAKEKFEKRAEKRKEVLERVQQVRAERIGEIEGLSDKQKGRLNDALVAFDEKRLQAHEAKHAAMLDLRAAMAEKEPSEKDVANALDRLQEAEASLAKARADKMDALEDILPPVQRARFLMAERRFEREVMRRIGENRRRARWNKRNPRLRGPKGPGFDEF